MNGLDVTYLGVNLDATSQVAPYGNVPDYGKKVVGIKLRVKNSKDSSITMIGYQDGFHVVLHLNVGSERSRSRDKGPDALWDGSSLPSGQKPDLILVNKAGKGDSAALYKSLSAIAPTVVTEGTGVNWKSDFLLLADALGKRDGERPEVRHGEDLGKR